MLLASTPTEPRKNVRGIRVAHVVPNLSEGGAETLVRGLCPRLADIGIDVWAVSLYPSRLTPEQKAELRVPVIEIGRTGRGDIASYWRLRTALARLAPDVAHCHVHSGKYAGRFAALAAGVPHVVYTEHDPRPPSGGLYAVIDPLLDRNTRRVVAFTETHRARLKAGGTTSSISVIPNGIALARVTAQDRLRARGEFGVAPGGRLVMMLGRLAHQKNVELALAAFAEVRARSTSPTHLFIAGEGPLEGQLRALAARLDIDRDVTFAGYRRDARMLLPAADALLFPSRFEAMPLSLFEAMDAGVPVVTTPWAGVAEMTGDARYAFVSSGWTAREVALALTNALDRGPERRRVIEEAQRFARGFTIERTAELHARLYVELTGIR